MLHPSFLLWSWTVYEQNSHWHRCDQLDCMFTLVDRGTVLYIGNSVRCSLQTFFLKSAKLPCIWLKFFWNCCTASSIVLFWVRRSFLVLLTSVQNVAASIFGKRSYFRENSSFFCRHEVYCEYILKSSLITLLLSVSGSEMFGPSPCSFSSILSTCDVKTQKHKNTAAHFWSCRFSEVRTKRF